MFSWILLLQMRFKRLCKANILMYICQEVRYFSIGLSGQLLIYNWNYGELSMLDISIVILLILCHIIIILLVLRSQYLFTFSYIVLILAWVIGGLRARTTPWFFGHFWKCSEVVDNYFWRLSKMAEKSRGRSCSEPFNYAWVGKGCEWAIRSIGCYVNKFLFRDEIQLFVSFFVIK